MAVSNGNDFLTITGGLGINLLLMVLSSLLPLAAGIGLTFAMMKAKSVLRIILRIIGVLFYCTPAIILAILYYFPGYDLLRLMIPGMTFDSSGTSAFICAVLGLAVSHLGYFLIHFDANGSVKKNIIVNTLGLFSSLFAWSLTMSIIRVRELINTTMGICTRSYNYSLFFIALILVFVILAAINVPRMILKEKLK